MGVFRQWRLGAAGVVALHVASLGSALIAADFEMSLQVKSEGKQVSAKFTEEQPSATKPHPRLGFTTDSNKPLLVSWKATNAAKKTTFEDVVVHCLVVAENEPGQAGVPKLDNALQESALTMDFKPGDSATGEFTLKIDEPGAYLVRIETHNLLEKYGHDYYAELDLVRK